MCEISLWTPTSQTNTCSGARFGLVYGLYSGPYTSSSTNMMWHAGRPLFENPREHLGSCVCRRSSEEQVFVWVGTYCTSRARRAMYTIADCARGDTLWPRTWPVGQGSTYLGARREESSQAGQWADAPKVSATGALLLPRYPSLCWRGTVTGKRTGAARGLPAPGPGTPLMQCVIHYLMETAPGRTSSLIRTIVGTRLASSVWAR